MWLISAIRQKWDENRELKAGNRWLGLNQTASVITNNGANRVFNSHCSLLDALFSSLSLSMSFAAPSYYSIDTSLDLNQLVKFSRFVWRTQPMSLEAIVLQYSNQPTCSCRASAISLSSGTQSEVTLAGDDGYELRLSTSIVVALRCLFHSRLVAFVLPMTWLSNRG